MIFFPIKQDADIFVSSQFKIAFKIIQVTTYC